MFRTLLLLHRYLGIAFGLIVALWCLSGFVMMYVQYPELDRQEYLAGQSPLDFENCCTAAAAMGTRTFHEFTIEMLAGRPVVRAGGLVIDLQTGRSYEAIDAATAEKQAEHFLANSAVAGGVHLLEQLERDQWTVASSFDAHRPLYKFAAEDQAGTEIYVSGNDGRVVQATTSNERFWNWLGAVTHWIYPTALRQHPALWAQIIIWLSVASLFLVVVGVYLGIKQFGARADGSRSPYHGLNLWHHYSGLIFGLLTITWLFSGLLSMNPWGLFQSSGTFLEHERMRSGEIDADELQRSLAAIATEALPAGTVQLRSSILNDDLSLLAKDATGRTTRLDGGTLRPLPLPDGIWTDIGELLRPDTRILDSGIMTVEDEYYFSHHEKVALPVYRITFDDEEHTRYYFDPVSAELLAKFDSDARWYRWLFLGLHRGDFTAALRGRPAWDLILLPLLAGVTLGSVTGVWMGYRRLRRRPGELSADIASNSDERFAK